MRIPVFEVVFELDIVEVAWHEQHRVPSGVVFIDVFPESLREKVESDPVVVLEGLDRRDSAQSNRELEGFSKLSGPVLVDSHQLDRSEYVLRARLRQSTLQVDVPELLNHDVLPDQPSVLRNTMCEAFCHLCELMRVELTYAEDVV